MKYFLLLPILFLVGCDTFRISHFKFEKLDNTTEALIENFKTFIKLNNIECIQPYNRQFDCISKKSIRVLFDTENETPLIRITSSQSSLSEDDFYCDFRAKYESYLKKFNSRNKFKIVDEFGVQCEAKT